MAESGSGTSLEYTPTWALATVCFIFISFSLVLEHLIHLLTTWLKRHRKRALGDAVDRLKSELMLLGFISLLLAVTQTRISKICISAELADTMLPCRKSESSSTTQTINHVQHYQRFSVEALDHNLSSFDRNYFHGGKLLLQRKLADDEEETTDDDDDTTTTTTTTSNSTYTDACTSKGKVPLVTQQGLQQLHIFIFALAVMQIVYSFLTMALGRAKMKRWEAWEKETQTTEYQVANDPNRFRFTTDTSFGRRHMSNNDTSIRLWIRCFFRQFFHSVAKVDYFTLRHGFIAAHLSSRHSNFNFQNYIQKSLEEDFKLVVGISPLMWFIVVIFMLVDVHGWNVFLWVSYVPLLLVLVLGTKMEVIVARMAMEIMNQNSVVVGTPLVQPNDKLFWFGNPKFVLTILHYALFMNAFELAFFIWVTSLFGVGSCYHEHTSIIVTRLVLAVAVQVLCSYITLPLYALVTQMGSQYKSNVLEDRMAKVIKQWHADVREKRRKAAMQDNPSSSSSSWLRQYSSRPRLSNASDDQSSRSWRGKFIISASRREQDQFDQAVYIIDDNNNNDHDDDAISSSTSTRGVAMLEMIPPPLRR